MSLQDTNKPTSTASQQCEDIKALKGLLEDHVSSFRRVVNTASNQVSAFADLHVVVNRLEMLTLSLDVNQLNRLKNRQGPTATAMRDHVRLLDRMDRVFAAGYRKQPMTSWIPPSAVIGVSPEQLEESLNKLYPYMTPTHSGEDYIASKETRLAARVVDVLSNYLPFLAIKGGYDHIRDIPPFMLDSELLAKIAHGFTVTSTEYECKASIRGTVNINNTKLLTSLNLSFTIKDQQTNGSVNSYRVYIHASMGGRPSISFNENMVYDVVEDVSYSGDVRYIQSDVMETNLRYLMTKAGFETTVERMSKMVSYSQGNTFPLKEFVLFNGVKDAFGDWRELLKQLNHDYPITDELNAVEVPYRVSLKETGYEVEMSPDGDINWKLPLDKLGIQFADNCHQRYVFSGKLNFTDRSIEMELRGFENYGLPSDPLTMTVEVAYVIYKTLREAHETLTRTLNKSEDVFSFVNIDPITELTEPVEKNPQEGDSI